jgi:FMN phosphatase YigB (HAD superfamily)
LKKIILFDIDDVLFKTDLFIQSGFKTYKPYEDAKDALEKIKRTADIAILSKGEYNLQLDKLNKVNLIGLFKTESIFIVDEKSEMVKSLFLKFKDKDIFIIDDRLDNLEEIKKANSLIKVILIKRGRYQGLKSDFQPDFIVNSLEQILKFI